MPEWCPPTLRLVYRPNDGRLPIEVGVSCPAGLEPLDQDQVTLVVRDLVETLISSLDRSGSCRPAAAWSPDDGR
jgi:hypothetical protein